MKEKCYNDIRILIGSVDWHILKSFIKVLFLRTTVVHTLNHRPPCVVKSYMKKPEPKTVSPNEGTLGNLWGV